MGKALSIGVDLDGCNVMFQVGVNAYLRMQGYTDLRCDPSNYHFWEDWGWNTEQWEAFWKAGVEAEIIFNNAPFRGAVEAINALYDAGHSIHVITYRGWPDRPGLAERVTENWLNERGYKYNSLTFSKDKTVIKTDVFVEDNLDNYQALTEAGTECYLITRPWNKEAKVERRVRSIGEFSRRVLEKY